MSNLVETYDKISDELAAKLIEVLDQIGFCDEEAVILYPGTNHYNRFWREKPDEMTTLCDLTDKINPFEYNCIYIIKNGGYPKHTDLKRFGSKMSISVGNWIGNELLIDDEVVSDYNRPIVFDGTKIPHETTDHLGGLKYNLLFYKW